MFGLKASQEYRPKGLSCAQPKGFAYYCADKLQLFSCTFLHYVQSQVYRSFQSLSFARKLAPTIVHFVHISFIYTHSIPQQALRYCSFAALLSVAVRSYQLTSNNDVFIPFNRSLCYLFVHVVHSYKAHLDYMSFGHRGFGLKASLRRKVHFIAAGCSYLTTRH